MIYAIRQGIKQVKMIVRMSQPCTDTRKKIGAKVLRHFPLLPRLQMLFMSSKTAASMRWHEESRTKDGYLRHLRIPGMESI